MLGVRFTDLRFRQNCMFSRVKEKIHTVKADLFHIVFSMSKFPVIQVAIQAARSATRNTHAALFSKPIIPFNLETPAQLKAASICGIAIAML
jgi:hypothetical protein